MPHADARHLEGGRVEQARRFTAGAGASSTRIACTSARPSVPCSRTRSGVCPNCSLKARVNAAWVV
jgi:hypothetical protein